MTLLGAAIGRDGRKLPDRIRLAATLIAGLALVLPSLAVAGGLYVNEFTTTSQANAGAGRGAWAPDASVALHNPAAMTRLDDHGLAGGLGLVFGDVRFDPADGSPSGDKSGRNQVDFAALAGLNYVHHIADRVRFGLSIYTLSGSALDPDDDWAGRFETTQISLVTLSISPTLGIKLTDWLSIGGGPIATYGVLNWNLNVQFPALPVGSESQVRLKDFDDWQPAGRVGILLQPIDDLSLSVSYLSETKFKLRGDLDVKAGLSANVTTDLPLAQSIEVSAAWQATDRLMLLATFNWEDWSEANELKVSLPGLGRSINAATGFQDTFKFGAGANYRVNPEWLLQLGVMVDTSALNNHDRTTALPIDRQVRASVGFQHEYSDSLTLGGSFVYANLGQGEVNNTSVVGDYHRNDLFIVGMTLSFKTLPWAGRLSLGNPSPTTTP